MQEIHDAGLSLKIGDLLRIRDNREFNSLGIVEYPIIDMDNHSFAVQGHLSLKWWWHKKPLVPYSGNAEILAIIIQ